MIAVFRLYFYKYCKQCIVSYHLRSRYYLTILTLILFFCVHRHSIVACFSFFQVVIVGNGAVGKSSLIQRYCRGVFTKSYKKTIGVDFLEKHLRYSKVLFLTSTLYLHLNRTKDQWFSTGCRGTLALALLYV